jgi:glycerol-3-phosphate dehydrogenase (NAD(P)+)
MAEILVIGAGVMGSAFSVLLADCGHDVHLVGTHLDTDLIQGIKNLGNHSKLKTKIPDRIVAYTYDQLGEVLSNNPDLIVYGVNSAGVEWANQQVGQQLQQATPILMLTKGLAVRDNDIVMLPQIVRQDMHRFGLNDVPVGAVAGPCIAGELASRRESSVVITHPDPGLLQWLLSLVNAPYCHARPSTDIVGVEVCAALKNFYAIGVGYANGQLKLKGAAPNGARMNNLSAGLFVQAMTEIKNLMDYLGGEAESVYGLAGVGDLYVTCQAGRNSRLGRHLGAGLCYKEAKTKLMPDDTIEGAELALTIAPTLRRLLDQKKIDQAAIPLGITIMDAICDDIPMQIPWDRFYPTELLS